jgi:hypothetical protein
MEASRGGLEMTEDKPSECIPFKELDRILTSDRYYSEPEVLESIFNISTPPLPDDVQQEILNACAEKGEPLSSLESLTPTNTTASGIISHLVNAGLPYSDNNQGVAFDHEAIRVFFLAHEIALPWQLFPSSPLNSKKRMSQLLGLREIQVSLLEKANTRQRNNDEQENRELRRAKLKEVRARAETGKAESISIVSDGYINIYEDSDLRHEFLIRVAVLEKLSAELGLGFEKGDELEEALQQLGAIIDTVNKKPSKYCDDALKEEIKRYLDCWLSADNTTPEYAISQYRLSKWRDKYLGGQFGASIEVQNAPIVVQVEELTDAAAMNAKSSSCRGRKQKLSDMECLKIYRQHYDEGVSISKLSKTFDWENSPFADNPVFETAKGRINTALKRGRELTPPRARSAKDSVGRR